MALARANVPGRRIATLQRGPLPAGTHTFAWRGRTDSGAIAPAGMYFVRLIAEDSKATQRVIRLR